MEQYRQLTKSSDNHMQSRPKPLDRAVLGFLLGGRGKGYLGVSRGVAGSHKEHASSPSGGTLDFK